MQRPVAVLVLMMALTCAPSASASTHATTPTQFGSPVTAGGLPPGPVPAKSRAGVPAPILLLAVFAGLFLLVGAVAGTARVLGWDPGWAVAWRHSWAEAEYRIEGGWLALADRLRRRNPPRRDRGAAR
jgi:hypothetical protein